jgi:hypothetical protein
VPLPLVAPSPPPSSSLAGAHALDIHAVETAKSEANTQIDFMKTKPPNDDCAPRRRP